jgi:dienelactone hydrolase
MSATPARDEVVIPVDDVQLRGALTAPAGTTRFVVFAHGSGSGRLSPRNQLVAARLAARGFGTLLFDLLTEEEERVDRVTAHLRFDIPLLARRLAHVTIWLAHTAAPAGSAIGLFGASTGAAAALVAAATLRDGLPDDRAGGLERAPVRAVVSRGGRPDLAGDALPRVACPTLLLVGSRDVDVLRLNRSAAAQMPPRLARVEVIEGATHLFEEPGALDLVALYAGDWFETHLRTEALPPHRRDGRPRADSLR